MAASEIDWEFGAAVSSRWEEQEIFGIVTAISVFLPNVPALRGIFNRGLSSSKSSQEVSSSETPQIICTNILVPLLWLCKMD